MESQLGVVEHDCNPSTLKQQEDHLEFEANLIYVESSKPVGTAQWDPVPKSKRGGKKKEEKEEEERVWRRHWKIKELCSVKQI